MKISTAALAIIVCAGLHAPAHAQGAPSLFQYNPSGPSPAPLPGGTVPAQADSSGNLNTNCVVGCGSSTRTAYNPDVATVTTAGTAVAAFVSGHVRFGGYIHNPQTATTNLCISVTGIAASTEAADATGGTTCIAPGQSFTIAPEGATSPVVSVNATDAAHQFSGVGFY